MSGGGAVGVMDVLMIYLFMFIDHALIPASGPAMLVLKSTLCMAASNQYTVRLFDTPAGVTNVHVGDRFVYTGRRHDENLEQDFVLTSDDDERECPAHTTLKLTNSYAIEFAPRPRGTRGANIRLRQPRMQYEFEAVDHGNDDPAAKKFKCTVSVYDLKHMINTDQLRKIPRRRAQRTR